MSVLAQLCVIFGVSLVAEGISSILPFTFPGSVMAMVLLLLLLAFRVVKPHQLKETSGFFMDHMAIFFLPPCVGILQYKDVLLANVWAVLLISVLTAPLVFFVTGHVVQLTMKWIRKRKGGAE